jgi:hypothetical protein
MEWEEAKRRRGIKTKRMKAERGNDEKHVDFGLFCDALSI